MELIETGIIFDQLGERYVTGWSKIETYKETDDAIYFSKRDRSVLAVRKRLLSLKIERTSSSNSLGDICIPLVTDGVTETVRPIAPGGSER